MKTEGGTAKISWIQLRREKDGDLKSDQKPGEKQKEKTEHKVPIIAISKEAKERLLKKTHGARDTLK